MVDRAMADVCEAIEPVNGVSLRPWSEDDVAHLVEAWNDPEIARWNSVPSDSSAGFASAWITGAAVQREDDVGIDVVMERAGLVIGEIGIQINSERLLGEIGFWIGGLFRGQGLGSTMLALGIALGKQLGLQGLVALVDPENVRTVGLLDGAGWTELPTQSNRRAFGWRL